MVEMRDAGELERFSRGELLQNEQQRHRIGAAGHGGHHPIAACDQRVPPDRTPGSFVNRHALDRRWAQHRDSRLELRPRSQSLHEREKDGAGAGT